MTYGRHTGDAYTALLDRLAASGAPVASVAVHGREVELELDPDVAPAQGMSVLRGMGVEVNVHRTRLHADLRAKIGRWRVRLRVSRT